MRLTGRLMGRLTGRLTGWLMGRVTGYFVRWASQTCNHAMIEPRMVHSLSAWQTGAKSRIRPMIESTHSLFKSRIIEYFSERTNSNNNNNDKKRRQKEPHHPLSAKLEKPVHSARTTKRVFLAMPSMICNHLSVEFRNWLEFHDSLAIAHSIHSWPMTLVCKSAQRVICWDCMVRKWHEEVLSTDVVRSAISMSFRQENLREGIQSPHRYWLLPKILYQCNSRLTSSRFDKLDLCISNSCT